jgi:hypothetical protein
MKGLKTGGRQKGTPNRESAFVGLALEKRGFSLVDEALSLYADADTETRIRLLGLLFPYVYPKRVDAAPEDHIDVTPENELQYAKETIKYLAEKFPELMPKNES